jgi:hypothetical protein
VRALEERDVRTGYADFSQAAPVTMFTAERVLISPALGPTPYYASVVQEDRVRREGPDAFILRPEDDAEAFAETLRSLGVGFELDRTPVPIFHHLSRRVAVEDVRGFRGEDPGNRGWGGEE